MKQNRINFKHGLLHNFIHSPTTWNSVFGQWLYWCSRVTERELTRFCLFTTLRFFSSPKEPIPLQRGWLTISSWGDERLIGFLKQILYRWIVKWKVWVLSLQFLYNKSTLYFKGSCTFTYINEAKSNVVITK